MTLDSITKFRHAPADKKRWQAAARKSGITLSEWIRRVLDVAAKTRLAVLALALCCAGCDAPRPTSKVTPCAYIVTTKSGIVDGVGALIVERDWLTCSNINGRMVYLRSEDVLRIERLP